MIVTPIKTPRVSPGQWTLIELLDSYLKELNPRSVVVISSKVVSLCEGSVAPLSTSKEELVRQQAQYFLSADQSKYGLTFTITRNTLLPNAGVDEANAGTNYVVWPRDPWATCQEVRAYLQKRFTHREVGVIVSDSTSRPFRMGASGIAIACSGFAPLKNYRGQADLFGRPFQIASADIAGGLAAAATVTMGEGAESTPLAVIGDANFIEFVDREPNQEERALFAVSKENDLYELFWGYAPWATHITR